MMFGLFGRAPAPQTPSPTYAELEERPSHIPKVRRSRPVRSHVRQFDAGQTDRLTAAWPSTPLPADDIVRRYSRVLVARSREQCTNNDYGKAFLRIVRQNVVGPQGVILQAHALNQDGSLDTPANDALEKQFAEWGKPENCDVAGRQSWKQLQKTAISTAARDGEFIFRKIYGEDAGPWGFALQAIDPQRCPVDYDVSRTGDGRFIRHGIEFNRYGRPLAFFFTTTNEAEADYFYGGRALIRVPADEIIHGFLPEIIGQKRGLPWTATTLWRMHMLHGYENAAAVNARSSAAKGGFFQWREGYGPGGDEDPEAERAEIEMEVEPGIYRELPDGLEFIANNPTYPLGEFAPFRKEMLRAAASGLGVAYNNFANDLEGVNYSSIRQGTLDEREHWKDLQEWFIEQLVSPVYLAWLRYSLLAGKVVTANGAVLPAAGVRKFSTVVWQGRRWQWIDPNADVKAAVTMKDNLMGSPGQFIRDQGRDPQTVWREIAQDRRQMLEAGIPERLVDAAIGTKLAAATKPPAQADAATGNAEEDAA